MEQLINNSKYSRGSEWRKWDLHIHSPFSILNNQYPKLSSGEPDWDSFIQKLELLDHAVIGITDYFTIEGYKKLKEYKTSGRLKNIHTILPNIEFRLTSVLSSKKDGKDPRRLNFHVIFSDEVSIKDIEEHFLHDIDFFYEGNPQDKDDKRKLKISNLEELGKKLMSQHKHFQNAGLTTLEVGAMQTVVDHGDITEILNSGDRFKGKYLLVFPEQFYNLIDWDGQDHLIRKGILQKSDMVFSSNSETRKWCLGKGKYLKGEKSFIEEFKTLKSCIHGSDAHKLEDIGRPCALRGLKEHSCGKEPDNCQLRYCWVKSDPTFEGLKQLLYEPESRVVIQEQNPSRIISNSTISKISIGDAQITDGLSIEKTNLELSGALVAVVGSRGSGKTAFVDLIANCYSDRCDTDDKNSFIRRIIEHDPRIPVKILFKGGEEFSKDVTDKRFIEDEQTVYIAQGELEKYIGDESDIDDRINELIFESPKVKNSLESFEYGNLLEKIMDIENQIRGKNQLISELEDKTTSAMSLKIDSEKKLNEADLEDVENHIEELKKVQSTETIKMAQQEQKSLGALKDRRERLISLREALKVVLNFLDERLPEFNKEIQSINGLLKELGIEEEYSQLFYPQQTTLSSVYQKTKEDITKIASDIDKAQKKLNQFEQSVQRHAKLLDKKQEINATLKKLNNDFKQFKENREHIADAINERKDLMRQLFESLICQKKKYKEIIDNFSSEKLDVLSDLSFVAEIYFNADNLLTIAEEVLDNRKVNIKKAEGAPSEFQKLLDLYKVVASGDENKIDDLIGEIENCDSSFRSKIKGGPITLDDFYTFLYGNYMRVIPIAKYKNTDLDKLSLGQKATVLIKIYLAQGDKPIIIDSHDDHLDNEFIMEELVDAFREAKNYRQIILVSNNGNMVINSDAEQIVITNRNEAGNISYMSGSIENPAIRNRILKILEGGVEAFRNRQLKYRIGH